MGLLKHKDLFSVVLVTQKEKAGSFEISILKTSFSEKVANTWKQEGGYVVCLPIINESQ